MTQPLAPYQPALTWIAVQKSRMTGLVRSWAEINSYSENLAGLERMSEALKAAFAQFPHAVQIREVALEPQLRIDARGNRTSIPLGKALVIRKESKATRRVLLSGHMDTVYPPDGDFITCQTLDHQRLQGPGVADLKGGLVVLLLALEAFERSSYAEQLGWTVIINPDEEIGSTGSGTFLRRLAKEHQFGLVFEPGLPDGSFVSARKGSATYTLIARGQAAHVGRDFHLGRNAIVMLLPVMQELVKLSDSTQGTTLNLGNIQAGTAVNIVPDLGILRFGLRAATPEAMAEAQKRIRAISGELELIEISARPPKIFDARTEQFYRQIKTCADMLALPMRWQESGGVCDGNLLAAEGLLTIDTLGPIGAHLHTSREYVELNSLVPKAQLAALMLMKIADGALR
jgi:glutamate carboxypeptidase